MTIFGVTSRPAEQIVRQMRALLGVAPRIVNFGTTSRLFFYTNQGDLFQNSELIALKVGHVRNRTYSPLSTQELLTQKILSPDQIAVDAFRGNAQLVCISLIKPAFLIYQTFMALPQLFYTTNRDGSQIYATNYRALLPLCDQVEVDESVIPMFFLLRQAIGRRTYFRQIHRLFAGELLTWSNGKQRVRIVRSLSSDPEYHTIGKATPETITRLYENMKAVMGAYLTDFAHSNRTTGNLLSGGVDSSILQILLNQLSNQGPLSSFSYAIQAASFEPEVKTAKEASRILKTKHDIFELTADRYLDGITRAIEVIARPQLNNESTPGKFALAEHLARQDQTPDVYFAGQGADALHGLDRARKVMLFNRIGQMPGARLLMKMAARLLAFSHPDKARGLQEVARMLPRRRVNETLKHPLNTVAILSDLPLMQRCFGEKALLRITDERYQLVQRYLPEADLQENVHTADLLTAGYEPAAIGGQFFAAFGRQIVEFYLDEEIIRTAYAFKSHIRFLQGWTTKPLLKKLLTQQGYEIIANRPKGETVFTEDLFRWFRNGPLAERIRAVERPGFLSRKDFEALLADPTQFSWNLLLWDIFQRNVIEMQTKASFS